MIRRVAHAIRGIAQQTIIFLKHRGEMRQLLRMDDYRLADIGLTRCDVLRALNNFDPYSSLAESRERNLHTHMCETTNAPPIRAPRTPIAIGYWC